ncbi:hypothetical protein TEA_010698 [Camellia sinensis var. sinensis]|uniref:Protein kinase domain-containing protein n=1 Tax=Camellia sinensis var. sinensis TaxID=542762 RepID=A0A4S4E4C3_CAMSN|nr:hypothetical protein TEA_010698 [Camellia sinensis var. sinensis]
MGYLSCNAESAISVCDPHNWDLPRKHKSNNLHKPNTKSFQIREFSHSDLFSATNSFSVDTFLGKGSHGSVYKASLDDGELIAAVKKTTTTSSETNCTTSPAENEIEILSRVRSPRLTARLEETSPVRFADSEGDLHLSNPPVIHRDIKSSNVLIDDEWKARLGDFGLALRGHVEDVRVKCTPPAGTLGYLDPGYLAPGDLSTKSDVFSFGILLLEIISGRNAIDMNYSPPSVVDWAAPLIRGGDYAGICDPRIGPPEDAAAMRQLAVLAARCVRSTAEKRPEMSDAVDCLRAVNKRVSSPIWNNLGRRVGQRVCNSSQSIKYEPLDDSMEICKGSSRVGSRKNRKVSSVTGVESGKEVIVIGSSKNDRVARSKSVGSVHEMKLGPLDTNLGGNQVGLIRRRAGLAVKMPMVRLSKSRSMGMLQSSRLVNNNGGGFVVQLVRNPNCGELESSKLLINLEKKGPEGETI